MKIFNILLVGVGGQGIILASDIITKAAMIAGFDSKKSEIHGMSQRGGSVFSHVRFGEKIYSPVISEGEVDIFVSLEEMETLRWLNYLNPETKLIFTENRILPSEVTTYPENIKSELSKNYKNFVSINQEELIKKIGKPKYFNTAILGLISNYIDFNEDAWKKAILEEAPEGTFEENWSAFITGKGEIK